MTVSRAVLRAGLLAVTLTGVPAWAADSPTAPVTYELREVAPRVHLAVAQGAPYFVTNSVVILGAEGVLVVDSGAGPREGEALRAAIRSLTPLPVLYVVDTHFHFDHALGHAAFPGAITIGHEGTRAGLVLGREQPTLAGYLQGIAPRVAALRAKAEQEMDPARRNAVAAEARAWEDYGRQLAALTPSAPRLSFTDRLTVWLGDREVRLLHLGRGHTAGDVVVYLPAERVVCTGDLFNGSIGFMGDAYVGEWAATLERLAQLDFRLVIAGHGQPFEGKDAIAPVQACLRDVWQQATEQKRAGVAARDAAARIDLSAHASRFPQFAKPGIGAQAVERIYSVLSDSEAAGR